jgi:hypothetical protein
MLKIVSINITMVERDIGGIPIGELDQFDVDALLFRFFHSHL